MEEQGREFSQRLKNSKRLRSTDKMAAAKACPHGGGYSTPSIVGKDDPRNDQEGFRCLDCGSFLSADPWEDYTIIAPCELEVGDA